MTNRFVYIAKQSLPNGTHLKAKNVSSEQIRVLKNDKRICSRLTALTKKAKSVSSQANTSLRAVCMRGNYLILRSGGLRIRVLKKMNVQKTNKTSIKVCEFIENMLYL